MPHHSVLLAHLPLCRRSPSPCPRSISVSSIPVSPSLPLTGYPGIELVRSMPFLDHLDLMGIKNTSYALESEPSTLSAKSRCSHFDVSQSQWGNGLKMG